jgi:hypothetical protein
MAVFVGMIVAIGQAADLMLAYVLLSKLML